MVAIPQAVDQPSNADHLEAIGVGRYLRADLPRPPEIGEAILGIAADPMMRLRLNEIRDELHRVGGAGHAAQAVEDAASGRG
jgi:UDP:flavonoid glycosyltransferase YjiC (YdhE family)